MPIDSCCYTFLELATDVLPEYMRRLQERMREPVPMARFAVTDKGATAIARELGLGSDFRGCYVLMDGERPFYTGISRKVLSRLRQHALGESHNVASLAFNLARQKVPIKGTRDTAMADPVFQAAFVEARERLRGMSVAFVQIENAVERYLFEVYCAMALDTSVSNTFDTH